jgi:hypothetical protein
MISSTELSVTARRRSLLVAAAGVAAGGVAGLQLRPGAAVAGGLGACANELVQHPSVAVTQALTTDASGYYWFGPGTARYPGGGLAMVVAPYIASDYFGQPHFATSADGACTWATPTPIAAFAATPLATGVEERYIGVLPSFHPPTLTMLLAGTATAYNVPSGSLNASYPRRIAYAVRAAGGAWSSKQYLAWATPGPTGLAYTSMLQRLTESNGNILLPVQFTTNYVGASTVYSSTTLLCSFDGTTLTVLSEGTPVTLTTGRGLFEPSLAKLDGTYYMTLRAAQTSASSGRAYLSTSSDGLSWSAPAVWTWDDGTPLNTRDTQAHFLTRTSGLYLLYTRLSTFNSGVVRWRLPIYMAQVDTTTNQLIRRTEQVVMPMMSTDTASYSGNFSVASNSDDEFFVADAPFAGDGKGTFVSRVNW